MRYAAQEALCNPEFCSTLGRRKAPFCLSSSRKQEADEVWEVWDGVLPQVSRKSGGTYWTSLELQMAPEGLWTLIQAIVSDLTDSGLCFLIKPLGTQCLHQLAELTGKRGHLQRIPFPICPLQGAASPGISSGRSQWMPLTWTDPGAGRPPKRQEDGWALGALLRPGGKRGEESRSHSL